LEVCGSDIAEKLQSFSFHNKLISKISEISYEQISEGRVLIVDDININLLIANEMLQPYGLHIETAENGLEAIEKIRKNGNYDIVFMDHMMPVMDGLKATKTLRETGYTRPIVALTANAVLGQEEMFLANGFDAFIAKPIDSHLLDQVVTRFIKNTKHLDVKHLDVKRPDVKHPDESEFVNKTVDFLKMEKVFISDAENAISVLRKASKEISKLGTSTEYDHLKKWSYEGSPLGTSTEYDHLKKWSYEGSPLGTSTEYDHLKKWSYEGSPLDGKDLESYIIAVHGVKSALIGIGEKALSDLAYKLEQAGKNRKYDLMASDTPVLIEALSALVQDFKSKETEEAWDVSREVSGDTSREDMVFLHEKLDEIKTACQKYNVKAAKNALADLKQKTWPRRITDINEEISIDLLCGEFKKILSAIEKYEVEIGGAQC